MDHTYASLDQLLMNGGDGVDSDSKHIVEEEDHPSSSSHHCDGSDLNDIRTTTDHPPLSLGDISSTHPQSTTAALDEPDSADDVVTKLLKEHRQQMGEVDDHMDGDLNDDEDDEDADAVVNRQLSASFGDDQYDDPNMDNSLHHRHHLQNQTHEDNDTTVMEMVTSTGHGADTMELHHHHQSQPEPEDNDEEEEEELANPPPKICRICHKMDDRPVLRFAPVEYDMNVVHAAPHVQTFPLDICVHVFCGKTASILPNVNQPEYEILTKAGIKNKHGIGGEVNAALSRTRCATLPAEVGKEKQFYLVREFEAHLAAVRGYIQSNQQHQHQQLHQQQLLMHQNHYNPSLPSIAIAPPPPPSAQAQLSLPHVDASGINGGSHSGLNASSNSSYLQPPLQQPSISQQSQSMAALSSTASSSQLMTTLSSPTCGSSNQYSQLLQRLNNNNAPHHAISSNGNSTVTLNLANGTIMGTPSGHSSQLATQQQQTTLSNLMLNSVGALDQLYTSTIGNSSNDILSMNQNSSNNTGSPTLEQLESMLQQQQQVQQQQNSSAASSLLANSQSINYATASSTGTKKTIPVKAGNANIKYQSPQMALNTSTSVNSDFKVYCECGGTHLSMHTTKGLASYKNHLSTKRHQKYVADQEQMRFTQIMSTGNTSGNGTNSAMMNLNHSTANNNITNTQQFTSSTTHPLLSNTNLLLGQNQFHNFIESMNNNSSNNISNGHTTSDNNTGGNNSSNSSVYGAAV